MTANFSPTPAEATLVNQIFLHADPQKLGVITGDAAVKIFDGVKLPPSVLGEIWARADEDNNGWLSRKGVAIAVRLIGWAQKGEKVTEALLQRPGPLAKIEGLNILSQQSTGMSLPKSPLAHFPPLTPQDKEKFQGIFLKSGPMNGLLSGDKARDIFLKSRLPNEQLIQVWNLADTQDRGNLDPTDFAIGMYFIQGLMSKKISFIPSSLPPGLYQQAAEGLAGHISDNRRSFSPTTSAFGHIQPQYTGSSQQTQVLQPNHTGMSGQSRAPPALPTRPAVVTSPFSPPARTAAAWDVTPADKATSDQWFDNLDKQKVGYIEGDVAVPFMLQSGLPGETLATVWDLADLNNDGRLTQDGFAVAMYLIQKKLTGVDIPTVLPPSLIPPSMRAHTQPEAPKDLFSFDDSPPPSAVAAQPTGGFPTLQPQHTGPLPSRPSQPTGFSPASNDPFASSRSPPPPVPSRKPYNFLDDDEPTITSRSPPLQDQSAEIGNAKNHLSSTNRSLEAAKAEREALEQTLANQAAQLSSLQTQLSLAKAAYETEIRTLATLKERHSTQQAEIQKAREELIRAESELSARKVEKAEIEGSFLRDKEDHRELHRRMIEVGQQAEAMKVETDKLKKEAKQQKGLLAIAKKQLSAKEAEKAKAEQELEETNSELTAVTEENKEVEAALAKIEAPLPVLAERGDSLAFAAAQPLPATPHPSSPSVSIKSNNPFERLAMTSTTPRTQSPFAPFQNPSTLSQSVAESQNQDVADDDIFGFNPTESKNEDVPHAVEGLPYDSPDVTKPASLDISNGLSIPQEELQPTSPLSATTDLFVTPPSSARNPSPNPSLDAVSSKFPAIDQVAAQFPPAETAAETAANGNPHQDFETNFDAQVKEIDVDESDSDSDDDEVPLAVLSHSKQAASAPAEDKGKNSETKLNSPAPSSDVTTFDDIFGAPSVPTEGLPKASTSPVPTKSETFDDIFGSPSVPSAAPLSSEAPATHNERPFETVPSETFPSVTAAPVVAGVDAFDEALNKISATTPTALPQFSFDSEFDDNFDFAAAKAEFPAIAPAPLQNGASASSVFDDVFAPSQLNGHSIEGTSTSTQPEPQVVPAELASKPDAPDIFATVQSSPAPALETNPFPQPAQPPVATSTNPFPTSSAPSSPQASTTSRPSSARPSSPFTRMDQSPPPRTMSPKPRLSSSSSKDSHEKPKEPVVRHSKLSIRLPFGRKKKQQTQHEPMPPPSTHLSPHIEGPERSVTPATDDDVEPVKQLTDMGFSRTQAVAALEKYGYDVQRALNSLLGAQ